MAGASTSFSDRVPNSASMTISPPGVPGVTAARGPVAGGYSSSFSLKNSGVASVGATPRALMPITFPVSGLKMRACVSPPQLSESNIVQAAASMAQVASTALPPRAKIMAPAVAARGFPVIATQCFPWRAGFTVGWASSSRAVERNRVRLAKIKDFIERMGSPMPIGSQGGHTLLSMPMKRNNTPAGLQPARLD